MNESYRDDAFINSIIGEGTRFKGEFDLNGLLRIDGDFTGSIRTKGKVLVGRNGRAECTMHAGTVVIGGVMRGEIFSTEKVIILSTGLMLGNITSPRLIVEEGVIVHGTCTISPDAGVEKEKQAGKQGEAGAKPQAHGQNGASQSQPQTQAAPQPAPQPQAHGQNGSPSPAAQTAPQPAGPAPSQPAQQPAPGQQHAGPQASHSTPPPQGTAQPQGAVKPPQGTTQPPAQGMASPQRR